ncbi:MAG TPA: glycosyltransferase [Verrucomicrobiae bacterium]|nr:glycosyltransferase [Verrucomicrobiae bacterium]
MEILWVKPGKLLPLDTGGKLRSYYILRHLSKAHRVTYLSYYGGDRDISYEAELRNEMPGAVVVHDPELELKGFRRYLSYLGSLPDAAPYSIRSFTTSRVRRLLASREFTSQFNVAVCDFLASTLNFPSRLSTPTVLFQHNVEGQLWQRRVRFASNRRNRIVAMIECSKMRRFESEQIRRFHHVFAVSPEDREAMASIAGDSHVTLIPTGVDVRRYQYDPGQRSSSPVVMFSGSMDWEPNIDGVEYFGRQIWPEILKRVPEARFRIVGRDPDPRVRRLASSSIEVTGTVPSMIDHLRAASVLVVPLRIGGGTRIKIYEGMAMGRATVSTRLGAEGLDVHHGGDILLADDPLEFAKHVVSLLLDENLRCEYGKAAALTAQKHDWSVVAAVFAGALRNVCSTKDKATSILSVTNSLSDIDTKALQSQG